MIALNERILHRDDDLNSHARRVFEVGASPSVLRWSGLDGEFELRVYLGTNSRCSAATTEGSYPYTELGYAASCAGSPEPVVISGSGAMVLSDPGKYVLVPVVGSEPTAGIAVVQPVDPTQAGLLLASRNVSLASCGNTPCPVEPPLGLVTSWN